MDNVGQIAPAHLRGFLDACKGRQNRYGAAVSTYTVHKYARALRAFLRFLVDDDLLDERVARKLVMPRLEKKVLPILTPAQIDALLKAATCTRDKAIVAVLYDSGIRAGELVSLRPDDVHFDADGCWLRVHGKGNKWREVGIGRQARALLHRYIHRERPDTTSPTVFVGQRGPLTVSGIDQILYALRDRAGAHRFQGVRVSAHTLRHSYAVASLERGNDLYRISRAMVHASIQTTTGYLGALSAKAVRQNVTSVLDTLAQG